MSYYTMYDDICGSSNLLKKLFFYWFIVNFMFGQIKSFLSHTMYTSVLMMKFLGTRLCHAMAVQATIYGKCTIFLYSFPVAQLVEHGVSNAKIMGSIPRESKSW